MPTANLVFDIVVPVVAGQPNTQDVTNLTLLLIT